MYTHSDHAHIISKGKRRNRERERESRVEYLEFDEELGGGAIGGVEERVKRRSESLELGMEERVCSGGQ